LELSTELEREIERRAMRLVGAADEPDPGGGATHPEQPPELRGQPHLRLGRPPQRQPVALARVLLERQPGFVVNTARTVRRQRAVRCSSCGTEIAGCVTCGDPYTISTFKGLNTRMVCDLLTLNAAGACDVPIVVSSDTDLIPVLEYMVGRGVKVIHAAWRDSGTDLARTAWASIDLDALISELIRS
jgi:uncharacterized LabA/DUF88 family protein